METRIFGRTDMLVSPLGFGGSEIGSGTDLTTVARLLDTALDAGLNVVDTAACYGASEELIGQAISGRRRDFYLFTKCGHASGLPTPDWDPRTIAASIDRSLERLRTDYLDLIQLHSCGVDVLQRGDVIQALLDAKASGKVRYVGYSGDNEGAKWAVETGRFDTLQTSINVADQSVLDEIVPAAYERGMGVIAKRPIANVAWQYATTPDDTYVIPYWERLQRLRFPFTEKPLSEAVGEALRFTLSVPGVSTAIVGTRTQGRWQENARFASAGPLPPEDYEALRQRWKNHSDPSWTAKT